jgi:hypothetical protein
MTSPTASYRKPITASGCGFAVEPIDRAFEDEMCLLNRIVDEQGWKEARHVAVSHLTAAMMWLSQAKGQRYAYDVMLAAADNMLEFCTPTRERPRD